VRNSSLSFFYRKIGLTISALIIAFLPGLAGEPEFWAPKDPPKAHYRIEAKINLEARTLKGRERIAFSNPGASPISTVAFEWEINDSRSFEVKVDGRPLSPLNPEKKPRLTAPILMALPAALNPGKKIELEVNFQAGNITGDNKEEVQLTKWYPRLWWDGLPGHDSFEVKLDIPPGYVLAVSGALNKKTGYYENDGARTFGIYLAGNMKTESREVEGVLVTTLATEKGAKCAAVCLETAVDVIKFCRSWLGFYPFKFLTIIPGGSGRWGGYPVATGIVAIHGQETFKEDEPLLWWQWITAHEIGHEYWGEWVLDPDTPDWLWIGLGIMVDTEYLAAKKIDPERRVKWMSNYLGGVSMYNDTTVDIPPARLDKILYDYNNTVIHSKGFSIISALDSALGRETFERIYKKGLKEYGGKRLGWREFQRFCEQESGHNLAWFFDQWVRSNAYLCYKIDTQQSKKEGDEYISVVRVQRLGTMKMPMPVKAVFMDGSEQVQITERNLDVNILTFRSKAELREAVLDPEKKLARLDEPLPKISEEAAEILSLGWRGEGSTAVYKKIKDEDLQNSDLWYRLGIELYRLGHYADAFDCFRSVSKLHKDGLVKFAALGWMGLLKDLLGQRPEALTYYRDALKYDSGEPMNHWSLRIQMDRKWVEERMKEPFTLESRVEIPALPTPAQLAKIIRDLNWTGEGKTPFLVYRKAKNLEIGDADFWLKLGLLLFDSGYYPEAFISLEKILGLKSPELDKFTALTWMGHLLDLQGQRARAVEYYQKALEHDSGGAMQHGQYGMTINRQWVEERLKTPFSLQKKPK
jgi:tetratricopeptide (TPR) repeat protein